MKANVNGVAVNFDVIINADPRLALFGTLVKPRRAAAAMPVCPAPHTASGAPCSRLNVRFFVVRRADGGLPNSLKEQKELPMPQPRHCERA